MHDNIPDFTDTELRLEPGDRELAFCPVVYWHEDKTQFVIFKTGVQAYRNQFFYSVREQYGTGREEYTDIGECVTILLQVQADHAAKSAANPATN